MRRRSFQLYLGGPVVLLLLLGAAGCASKLQPVRGKVVFPDGKPLTEGLVVFEPEQQGNSPISARGEIQADGSYQLSTYKPGDGALPGKYRVLVAPKNDLNDADKPRQPPPFDPRYMAFDSSGLEFEVQSGANEFPIELTRGSTKPQRNAERPTPNATQGQSK